MSSNQPKPYTADEALELARYLEADLTGKGRQQTVRDGMDLLRIGSGDTERHIATLRAYALRDQCICTCDPCMNCELSDLCVTCDRHREVGDDGDCATCRAAKNIEAKQWARKP